MKKVFGTIAIATLGGFIALGVNQLINPTPTSVVQEQAMVAPVKYVNLPAGENANFVAAAEASVHSVVHVKTTFDAPTGFYYYDPFRDFFGQGARPQTAPQMSSGSGVIISSDGFIVTNNHVVDKAEKIEVVLNDKRTYNAEVIGRDPSTDLAVIKIKEKNLPFLTYGNSDDVKVGEWALAVGNPFNLTSTVTAGIVSAKGRNINILEGDPTKGRYPIESFIQTDAAVNPGNSGGALVNTAGQLIGINSAIASNTGSYSGYSFAIPVNIVKKVVNDLAEFGEVQRAYIGVNIRDLDAKFAKEKNLSEVKGVYVNGTTEGGAAEEAGVKAGDVVVRVGEVSVNSVAELQEQVSKYRPGDKVDVTIKRGAAEKTVNVLLKNMNGNTRLAEKMERKEVEPVSTLGASFEQITKEDKSKLNIENGVKIARLNSGKLSNAGIREGFIVTSIDKRKINTVDDIKEALENKRGGVLIEGVYPNGTRSYYAFGL